MMYAARVYRYACVYREGRYACTESAVFAEDRVISPIWTVTAAENKTHTTSGTPCCITYLGDQHGRDGQLNMVGRVSVAQPFHVHKANAWRALGPTTTYGGPRELAQRKHVLRQINAARPGLRSWRYAENLVPARQCVHEEGLATCCWAEDRHKIQRPRRERVCHNERVGVDDHRTLPGSVRGLRHPCGRQPRSITPVGSCWFIFCRRLLPPRHSASPTT